MGQKYTSENDMFAICGIDAEETARIGAVVDRFIPKSSLNGAGITPSTTAGATTLTATTKSSANSSTLLTIATAVMIAVL